MTTYRKQVVVAHRIEYGVEVPNDIGTVMKVMSIAYADWCSREGYDQRATTPGDWCKVSITDDEVVFAFEIERREERA